MRCTKFARKFTGKRAHKYRLNDGDLVYHTGKHFADWQSLQGAITFTCSKGKARLRISRTGVITVFQGYSWNGCSPKIRLGGFIWGTPDGAPDLETQRPKTWRASGLHDALCQFKFDARMPYSRAEIDQIFFDVLKSDKWEHALAYYRAVRIYANIRGLK